MLLILPSSSRVLLFLFLLLYLNSSGGLTDYELDFILLDWSPIFVAYWDPFVEVLQSPSKYLTFLIKKRKKKKGITKTDKLL